MSEHGWVLSGGVRAQPGTLSLGSDSDNDLQAFRSMCHNDANEEDGGFQDILHGYCDDEEKYADEVATHATVQTKCSISMVMGVFTFSILEASETICPMMVPCS